MEVFRISAPRYAQSLTASGVANRWNTAGQYIIYTAATASLACLENVVHRSGEGLSDLFKVVVIDFPDELAVEEFALADLPADWQSPAHYARCQPLGAAWYARRAAAVLRVPSSVIAHEFNYVFNTQHPDFARVRLVAREDFGVLDLEGRGRVRRGGVGVDLAVGGEVVGAEDEALGDLGDARLAAGEDGEIARRHLIHALRREYEKAGRAFPGDPDEPSLPGRTHG